MTEPLHDWWSNLTPFEKSSVRLHEHHADEKKELVATLKARGGNRRRIARLELEIAGHKGMRQQYQNRGTQRAKLGCRPSLTMRDRRITHVENRRVS